MELSGPSVLGSALTRRSGAQLSPAARDSIQAQVQATLDSWTDAWRRSDVVRELNDLEARYAGQIAGAEGDDEYLEQRHG